MIRHRNLRYVFVVLVLTALSILSSCGQSDDAPTTPATGPASAQRPSNTQTDLPPAARAVVAETLAYAEVDERLVKGHFVFPEDMVDPLPAIILIHEWWGLNNEMRAIADRIAAEGYIVLAIDLFSGKVATLPTDARNLMVEVVENPDLAAINIESAYQWILATTGAKQVAAVGYGFGGGWSLKAALNLPEKLDAAVIYYGQVAGNEDALAALKTPVLGMFGGADKIIPIDSVRQFETQMEGLDKACEIEIYPGAKSGFASPGSRNFNSRTANESWNKMLSFLQQYLA